MSVPFQPDRRANAANEATIERLGASGTNNKAWNWRDIVARTAYRTGALTMLGSFAQHYEIKSHARKLLPRVSRVSQPKYAILCYHRVGKEGIPYYSTLEPAQFEDQMRFLREHFRVISLGQMCHELQAPTGHRNHGVAVTFDDGYSDLYTYALPALRKYQIPATVYLTVDCIETGEVAWYDRIFLALQVASGTAIDLPINSGTRLALGSSLQRVELGAQIVSALRRTSAGERKRVCGALEQQVTLPPEKLLGRMLSWRQVLEMQSAGISFGSHTLSHPVLSSLTAEEVRKELAESKEILEARLGGSVLDFAFPFGKPSDCGPSAHELAARCGYRSAATTVWGVNAPGSDMHALRRIQLGDLPSGASFALQLHYAFLQVASSSGRRAGPVPAVNTDCNRIGYCRTDSR